ncbi:MAG: hypothetical protein NVS3B20_09180 [Polyangiales bacterium]
MILSRWLLNGVAVLAVASASCALISKDDSVFFRYFTPERLSAASASSNDGKTNGSGDEALRALQLRLGRVNSASYLKDRIAFRDSANEIGFYELLLWTEKPEAYLRRAMSRALFEEGRVRQIISGPGPTLEIELNAFEELRAPRHAARVEVSWMLRDDQVVLVQRTLTVEHPIAGAKADAQPSVVATALGDALAEAIHTITTTVVSELARKPSIDH